MGPGGPLSRGCPAAAHVDRTRYVGGPLPAADTAGEVYYPVRAAVSNPDGLLKPDMTAYARVLTDPASTATRLFRGPVRWARLMWWRIWS